MIRASRSDNLFYSVIEIRGHYFVGLFRQNGEKIRSYDYSFDNEINALQAARVAVKVFEQTMRDSK